MDKTHLRWFTRATWQKLLAENAFHIITEGVAESMYPKEAFGPRVIEAARRVGDRCMPDLFATVLIFECSPNAI